MSKRDKLMDALKRIDKEVEGPEASFCLQILAAMRQFLDEEGADQLTWDYVNQRISEEAKKESV